MTITRFTTISEIYEDGLISIRAFHCCQAQKIRTVEDLYFFNKEYSLCKIRNCGKKTISELELILTLIAEEQNFIESPKEGSPLDQNQEQVSWGKLMLQDLYDSGRISARAFNCCFYNGIRSTSDLKRFKTQFGSFLKLRNCGKKTINELETILLFEKEIEDLKKNELDNIFKDLPVSIRNIIIEEFNKKPIETSESKKCIRYREILNTPNEFYNIILNYNSNFLDFYYSIAEEKVQHNLFKLLNSICIELKAAELENTNTYDLFNSCKILLSCINAEFAQELDEPQHLSSIKIDIIANHFKNEAAFLSERAKRVQQKYFPTYDQCIPYFGWSKEKFCKTIFSYRNMKKTSDELFLFIQNFKKIFYEYVAMTDEEAISKSVANRFPFLLKMQCRFAFEFNIQYGHYPMFYITTQYLANSEEKDDKLFSLLYGISDGYSKTLDEIAKLIGCTRERTRQIISNCKFGGIANSSEWKKYDTAGIKIVTSDDIFFTNILKTEKIDISFDAFAGICKRMFPFSIKKTNGKKYLILNELNKSYILTAAFRSIERLKITKYSEDYYYNIENFVQNIPIRKSRVRKDFIELIAILVQKAYHLEVDEKTNIIFPKNKIDYGKELFQILKDRGIPMNLEELFEAIKLKIPETKYDNPQQLRPIILINKNIKAIGKSSTYGLTEWEHINFGCIRDIIVQTLNDSETPVHIDIIMEQINIHYPNTNKKNVMSNLYEGQDVFISFIHGYYGLVGKKYGEEYILTEDSCRQTFEERFAQLVSFVQTYERLPNSSGGQEESSLFRWMSRVINGSTSATEEQISRFNAYIDANKNIPQNGLEYDFLISCRRYLEYVEEQYQLPTVSSNPKLYNWFKQQKYKYFDLLGNRKMYFDDLLNELRALEFDV